MDWPAGWSAHDLESSRWSSSESTPSATRARKSGSRSQPSTVGASSGGHHSTTKSTNDWLDSISSLKASRPRSRPRSPRTWRHITSSSEEATRGICRLRRPPASGAHQLAAQLAEAAGVEQDHVVTPEDAEVARRTGSLLARRTPHQLGHPGRALHRGDGGLVVAGRADAVDDLAERAQRDGSLAERGQHPLDVAHEDPAGSDDQHAAGLVTTAVGVEEVRRPVQRHDGLAGAGAAGDRGDPLGRRPDRLVLLGLDRGDDRVHGAVAGAGELRHQRALTDDRQVAPGLGVEQLVLDADDLGSGTAQHAAAYDVLGVGGGRLVEHRGRGRAPVDQQGVVVVVAQADAADVARVGVELGPQVETPEHQALVGGVELRHPLGGLEDHRVALDETALVAQTAPVVTFAGQLLQRPSPTSPAGRTPGRRTPAPPRSHSRAAPPTNLTPHPCVPASAPRTAGRQVLNFTR